MTEHMHKNSPHSRHHRARTSPRHGPKPAPNEAEKADIDTDKRNAYVAGAERQERGAGGCGRRENENGSATSSGNDTQGAHGAGARALCTTNRNARGSLRQENGRATDDKRWKEVEARQRTTVI